MRDKFDKTKEFVWRHRVAVAYLVGCGVGSVVAVHTLKSRPAVIGMIVDGTSEQLVKALEEDGALDVLGDKGARVVLFASDSKLLR